MAQKKRFSKRKQEGNVLYLFFLGIIAICSWEAFSILFPDSDKSGTSICPSAPSFEPRLDEITERIRQYPKLDLKDEMVVNYSRLVHKYLEPWAPIKGAKSGLGATGMVTPESLKSVGMLPQFMSCCGHVKIVNGKVYFRYGGFYHVYYRLHRFLQSVKMIQDAVNDFGLIDLRQEFYVNTCDHPISFYSSHWSGRAGYPIFSTGFTADTMDIPIPDPLDLTEDYTPDLSTQSPWETKEARAVFRGKTTNFDLRDGNWGANPRLRLHRMSDFMGDIMDAHVNSWSHATPAVMKLMEIDGLVLGKRMNFTQFNAFKYQVIVDGGGGSCRTCGVLRSNQLSIRQVTPMQQFYEPLMEDMVHWVYTTRTFSDLPEKVRWAQKHDAEAREIVKNSNEFAKAACTWHGRKLYWAVLLAKFQVALQAPEKITEPASFCDKEAMLKPPDGVKNPANVRCSDPDASSKQQNCAFFCAGGKISEDKFIWLKSDVLESLPRIGPP